MESIVDIVKGTPWWVFGLLVYVIVIGLQARKSRVVSFKKMFILPGVVLLWSLFGLFSRQSGAYGLFFWAVFFAAGCMLGFRLVKRMPIRADRKKFLIKVPGTNLVLILALAIFATKYFFGYYEAVHSTVPIAISFLRIACSGLISGILVGRMYCYLKKFATAHHEKLKVKKR